MSAFVVSKSHIDAMIRAGMSVSRKHCSPLSWYAKDVRRLENQGELQANYRRLDHETADQVGQMLVDACVRSVCYRYPQDDMTHLPGPGDSYWLLPYKADWVFCHVPTPVEALKLIDCFVYQSCEDPDFYDSEAYRFCEALQHVLISDLPGYEDAPWEWRDTIKV